MEDPKNAGATSELNKLNKQIKEQNLKDKLPKEDLENFLIQVPTFANNFEIAKRYYEALRKDPTDDMAKKKLTNINGTLDQLNERHGYPKTWFIIIPPRPGTDRTRSAAAKSSGAATSKAADKTGQVSTKGGVKTKIGVPIPDESDGRTSLGKIVNVKKAGFGSRVIVNRGTEGNPYFDIYLGAEFGKKVAKEWLEDKTYECKNLPKDTTAKQMIIYGRIKIKKNSRKRENISARTQSEIQYYLIKIRNENYISTRSALSGMKKFNPAKFKRIDAQLDRQNEQLFAELDQCREKNEHPDTGEQLANADIERMPWLSPDAIPKIENGDNEERDENENVGNIVLQRTGLKRNPKPKTVSRTPEASGITKKDSFESEL